MAVSSTFTAGSGEGYDRIMGRWSARFAEPFLDFSGCNDGEDILDAGCGLAVSDVGPLTAHQCAQHHRRRLLTDLHRLREPDNSRFRELHSRLATFARCRLPITASIACSPYWSAFRSTDRTRRCGVAPCRPPGRDRLGRGLGMCAVVMLPIACSTIPRRLSTTRAVSGVRTTIPGRRRGPANSQPPGTPPVSPTFVIRRSTSAWSSARSTISGYRLPARTVRVPNILRQCPRDGGIACAIWSATRISTASLTAHGPMLR